MGLRKLLRDRGGDQVSRHHPVFRLETDTKDITKIIERSLIELRLYDRAGGHADSLELELADQGQPIPDGGQYLQVSLGYKGDRQRVRKRFTFDQCEIQGPARTLRISATTADFSSQARAPRERSHGSTTLGDLIEKLAAEHGYVARVEPQETASLHLWHVDQAGQSDLGLAYELCAANGAIFKPVDDLWWVRGFGAIGEPDHTIEPGDVSRWRARINERERLGSVRAIYQDYDLARRLEIVEGDGEPQETLDPVFVDEATARNHARARLWRSDRDSRELELFMPGRPDIASQQVLLLKGFRPELDRTWLIKEAVHSYGRRGYTTQLVCEGV
jgi:uncharacterized protein